MKILIFYPPNRRSIAIETFCLTFKEAGYEVSMLSLTDKGEIHRILECKGINTFCHPLVRKAGWKYFLSQAGYLKKFCKHHKIDLVLSHLQEANIISVLAKPFLKAKLINFRHHAESAFQAEFGEKFGMKRSRKEVMLDKIINRFANQIIVPSSDVWKSMEKYEGADMRKVKLIPYIYDFSKYQQPDMEAVSQLRRELNCHVVLIMVSRMIESKQHLPVFEVVNESIKEGLSIKMIVMDDGPLRPKLEKFVSDHQLESQIIFTGFRQDFINYMAAADLLIHPSLTEASNNVAKEMALLEKGVAVCKEVGDFNEYIVPGKNGFFLDRYNLKASIEEAIRNAYKNPEQLKMMGKVLRQDVVKLFSDSKENRQRYLDLLN